MVVGTENLVYSWDASTTLLISSGLLNVFPLLVMLRVKHRYRGGYGVAAATPATGSEAMSAPQRSTSVTHPGKGDAADLGTQPVPVSDAPTEKKCVESASPAGT